MLNQGIHMGDDKRDLLTVLKAELEYLEKGGYRGSSWRPNFIFEDSPSCINYRDPRHSKPCSECALMQLVPLSKRNEQIPCRFIPLNDIGTTVDFLYKTASQDELEAEVQNWLKLTIAALEGKRAPAEPGDKSREERAKRVCA